MHQSAARSLPGPVLLLALIGAGSSAAQMHHDDPHAGPTMNHHQVSETLLTGGHFVGEGLAQIREQGVEVVIDLRDEPPEGQKEKLAEAGIKWVNIPVVWESPQPADFERFSEAMEQHAGKKVLVQCQANYRASAMTYLYRVAVANVPETEARADLNAVWEPSGRWAEYIDDIVLSH